MLPNEALLDVLSFVDFDTLVSAKFVHTRFLGVLTANEHLLAIQRRFNVLIMDSYISYDDRPCRGSIRYDRTHHMSFAAACQVLSDVIGQHAVGKLMFFENTWTIPGVDIVFDLAPALKFARDVSLNFRNSAQTGVSPAIFVRNFARPAELRLSLDNDAFRDFRWAFLGLDTARELRTITVSLSYRSNEQTQHAWEYADALQSVRRIDNVLEEFVRETKQLLEDAGREMTIELRHYGSDIRLDLGDNCRFGSVETIADTTLYSSPTRGVTVEVSPGRIVVCSQPSDGVLRKKVKLNA